MWLEIYNRTGQDIKIAGETIPAMDKIKSSKITMHQLSNAIRNGFIAVKEVEEERSVKPIQANRIPTRVRRNTESSVINQSNAKSIKKQAADKIYSSEPTIAQIVKKSVSKSNSTEINKKAANESAKKSGISKTKNPVVNEEPTPPVIFTTRHPVVPKEFIKDIPEENTEISKVEDASDKKDDVTKVTRRKRQRKNTSSQSSSTTEKKKRTRKKKIVV